MLATWLTELCRARSASGHLRVAKVLRYLHSHDDSPSPYVRALEAGCGYPEPAALACAEELRLLYPDTPVIYRACGQLLNASKACHDPMLGWQLAIAAGRFTASELFATPEQRMLEIAAEMVANLNSGKWGLRFWKDQSPSLKLSHHGYVSRASATLLSNCVGCAESDEVVEEALRALGGVDHRDYQTRQVKEIAKRNAQSRSGGAEKKEPAILHSHYYPY